jgi:hypothetical protein
MFALRSTTLSPFSADVLEDLLVVADQVHLVDREHQVRHAEQRGQESVPP